MPEENLWSLWCKGRLTEADTATIRLGTTPSGLTSAPPSPIFTGQMPFLPPNQQRQSTEGAFKLSEFLPDNPQRHYYYRYYGHIFVLCIESVWLQFFWRKYCLGFVWALLVGTAASCLNLLYLTTCCAVPCCNTTPCQQLYTVSPNVAPLVCYS